MKFSRIVILTGAGISAESGIKTFRASDGLWGNHRVEDVASPEGFIRNPTLVHQFYNQRRKTLLSREVMPNSAHLALASFEKKIPGSLTLITQNIDNLHERAGSKNIIHMHGELLKVICQNSRKIFSWKTDLSTDTICTCCKEKGRLRPHIVWFTEMPLKMDRIELALNRCDLFLSIGTSGHVYPAGQFVEIAKSNGAHTVELNLDPSQKATFFHKSYYGKASQTVPKYLDQLILDT